MLAPMQGVTNAAVRALFTDSPGGPDVVFTEFMRVRPSASGPRLSATEVRDAKGSTGTTPLVVQLIGRERGPIVEAAKAATRAGAVHLNLNLGCPFGRMNAGRGGALLQRPEALEDILPALRAATLALLFNLRVNMTVNAIMVSTQLSFATLPLWRWLLG